jgi:lipopolysaccharide export LptBFGC system permease protein LptF
MNWPWTIWRTCMVELWRLVLLSAIVLVSVLAFAASVRYLADGRLGPAEMLKFVFLGMLPMLQYALPFAGGFGATLAYHRMAQDNELVAAGGGGLSHRAILMPAFASGVVLSGLLLFLSSQVIPSFLQTMERMVVRDASSMVVASINSGQPLMFQDTMLHADSVRRLGPDPERGAYDVLHLTGVAAVELDSDGNVVREATASHARVVFAQTLVTDPVPGADGLHSSQVVTYISADLRSGSLHSPRSGVFSAAEAAPFHWAQPQYVRDSPKYLSNRDLMRLPQNPDRLNHIDNMRRGLAQDIAEWQVVRDLDAELERHGRVELTDADGRRYIIQAAGLDPAPQQRGWTLIPPGPEAPIVVERYLPEQGAARSMTRFTAESATLRGDAVRNRLNRRVDVALVMTNVRSHGISAEAAGELPELTRGGLSPAQDPLAQLLELPSRSLVEEARQRIADGRADADIARKAQALHDRLEMLDREVVSKLHERWAASAACLVMVLAGAVTAMRLGASLPLTVYLWSFFPALISVLTISAGQHITSRMGLWGLGVLWGGVGLLGIYTLSAFLLVRRF